jgi:hypothetical protein
MGRNCWVVPARLLKFGLTAYLLRVNYPALNGAALHRRPLGRIIFLNPTRDAAGLFLPTVVFFRPPPLSHLVDSGEEF